MKTLSKVTNDIIEFDAKKINLIKQTIAVGATDNELQLFLHQCKRAGLDPLSNQIYFQKFKSKNGEDKMSIIVGIDGLRLIADRTGCYAGNSSPLFAGEIEIADKSQWDINTHAPEAATVTVTKIVQGKNYEFSATAYWSEYYPAGKKGHMWRKMPRIMLSKCAEALALRKAFPKNMSGLYTHEEMAQAGESVNQPLNVSTAKTVDPSAVPEIETKQIEKEPLSEDKLLDFESFAQDEPEKIERALQNWEKRYNITDEQKEYLRAAASNKYTLEEVKHG